jgi:hypothetical protein
MFNNDLFPPIVCLVPIRKDIQYRFDLVDFMRGFTCGQTQPVAASRARTNIPELGDILRENTNRFSGA